MSIEIISPGRPVCSQLMDTSAVVVMAVIGVFAASTRPAHAVNILWGTGSFQTFVDSSGADLSGSFDAYLGYFDQTSPFTPSPANLEEWIGQFVPFDRASVTLTGAGSDIFTSSADLNSSQQSSSPDATPLATFPAGTQAYVWLRNQDTVNPSMEWALYSDPSWVFPAGTDVHDPGDVQWFLSSMPNNDVFGSTNYDGNPANYPLPTDPETRILTALPFGIQTGTILPAIPEPGTSGLVLVGLGLAVRRQRRRR